MTPFAWSQPHDVNEHVAGIAKELRALGHTVTVLAPSGAHGRPDRRPSRARARRGRGRDRDRRRDPDLAPVEPRRPGRGARATCTWRSSRGSSTSCTASSPACRASPTSRSATRRRSASQRFFSPERLGYPPRRSLREKLLARLDALIATSETTAAAAAERFAGDYRIVSLGVDTELFKPGSEAEADRDRAALGLAARSRARRFARCASCLAGRRCCCGRSRSRRGPGSRWRCATACAFAPAAGRRRGQPCSPRRRSSFRPRPARRGCGSRRWPRAPRSPSRRESWSSPSWPRRRSRGSPRTTRCASGGRRRRAPTPSAELRRGRGRAGRDLRQRPRTPPARAGATPARWPTAPGSSPTCTCTRTGRTTARSRSTSCSTTRRPRVSARSRSPTTTSSAARSRRSSGPAAAT